MAGRVRWFFRNLFWDLAVLTEWWPWLSSWFDTWSIMCDEETMQAIRNVEKWIAEGTLDQHTVPPNEVMKEAGFTQEELDSIPEPEVKGGRLVFKESPPKITAINETTGKEVV